jgi:hypothetical protein
MHRADRGSDACRHRREARRPRSRTPTRFNGYRRIVAAVLADISRITGTDFCIRKNLEAARLT